MGSRGETPRYDFLASDSFSALLKYNDERTVMQWLDKTVARMRELRGVRLYEVVNFDWIRERLQSAHN